MELILDILRRRVLVLDGAMGTTVQAEALDIETDYRGCENCTDILVLSRPDLVRSVHDSFLAVGADAVETNTFGANPLVLGEFGLADQAHALNVQAAQIAREACRHHATEDHPRFVLGSMGPGTKLITLEQTDWSAMQASYTVQANGLLDGGVDGLIIFAPDDADRETLRFTFPRQAGRRRLCISDFFLPVDTGPRDVIGMTCVTVGETVSTRTKTLFETDAYSEYLYLHGFGVECAEALAEYWHRTMRTEMDIHGDDVPAISDLFVQKYRGSRYSFGYPACPDMSDQQKLFTLLDPQRIGCTLTENWQIDPEQSTSALVVHHPAAKYFNV